MPSNDTQNIYSSEYGGEGAPIPATKIGYDNTTSGLTADDVQGAIDEVAGEVADLTAKDVAYDNTTSGLTADDVQEAIDELSDVKGNYVISDSNGSLVITADGVKDFATLLSELKTAIVDKFATLEDDEILIPKSLYVTSFYSLTSDYSLGWNNTARGISIGFSCVEGSVTKGVIARVVLSTNNDMLNWNIETTGNTVKNWLSDVPANTNSLTFYYNIIKKV